MKLSLPCRVGAVLAALAVPGFAQAPVGYVQVSAANLTDSSGVKIANATIAFAPVNNEGQPISYQINGSGQSHSQPVTTLVTTGAMQIQLADTALTKPVNVCFSVTITDNISGKSLLGPGYTCFQPAGSGPAVASGMCTATTSSAGGACSFDKFEPNLPGLVVQQTGPTGPQGPEGVKGDKGDAGTVTASGVNGDFNVPGQLQASTVAAGTITPTQSGILDWFDKTSACHPYRGEINVLDCGADVTGVADSTSAIALAHTNICAAGGGRIFYPQGTYMITPNRSDTTFKMCSNLTEYGTATIKVNPSTGDFGFIFGPALVAYTTTAPTLSNIVFRDLTIDENTVNNTTSTPVINCPSHGTYIYDCYQIVWLFNGGAGALGDGTEKNGFVQGLTIDNVTVYTGGVNAVVVTDGNANTGPSTVSSNANVINSRFVFEKRAAVSAFDNSAVFLDAVGMNLRGNTFTSIGKSIADGATTAFELHSSPGSASNNSIDWYKLGGYIVNTIYGASVTNNVITHAMNGLSISQGTAMNGVVITGNQISLDNIDRQPSLSSWNTVGIALANSLSLAAAVSNLRINGNTIVFQLDTVTNSPTPPTINAYNTGGISVFSQGPVSNVDIENNTVINAPTTCINLGTGDGTNFNGTLTNAVVTNNTLIDCGTVPLNSQAYNAAIWEIGILNNTRVYDNHFLFTNTTNPFIGKWTVAGGTGAGLVAGTGSFSANNTVTTAAGVTPLPAANITGTMGKTYPYTTIDLSNGLTFGGTAPSGQVVSCNGTVCAPSAVATASHGNLFGMTPLLSSVATGQWYAPYQLNFTATALTQTAIATAFTCTGNPTLTLYDCGGSFNCSSPTATLGAISLTAANTANTASLTGTFTTGHYIAWAFTGGTCSALQVQMSAKY